MKNLKPPEASGYALLRPIDRPPGGQSKSELWEALATDGRGVVLKIAKAEHYRLGLKEAKYATKLRHRNIVATLDRGVTTDGRPFYVMPRYEGSLADWGTRPVASQGIASALADVLAALEYLHGLGYVHGDIKPSNILKGAYGYVLADLETLHNVSESAGSGRRSRRATVQTAAPEILHGAVRAPSVATDLYSVGAVAHDLLACGRPIIRDEDTPEQDGERAAAKRKPPAWPRFAHWQDFLDRALEPDPKDRFRTAAEMLAALPQ